MIATLLRLLVVAILGGWMLESQAFVPFTGVGAIAAGSGGRHTCAIVAGAAKCWGDNTLGAIGDGTTTQAQSPVQVSGLTSGVTAIAPGAFFTCAIVSGGVKCWGTNLSGQLGDGTNAQRPTPAPVTGLTSGYVAVAAGGSHACALTSGGAVKCWGGNANGQVGDGSTSQRLTPVNVSGLGSGVVAISAGASHTCAVTNTGIVKCWGLNTNGQIGDNSVMQRPTPVTVMNIASGAAAVVTGSAHTCALVSGGAKCWGLNTSGQLGDGTQAQALVPVDVQGLTSGVAGIAAGNTHSCALTSATAMKCWGQNQSAQLGDGTLVPNRLMPVDVVGLTSGVVAMTGGLQHSCALVAGGAVNCWGDDGSAQLGDNATTRRLVPTLVTGQQTVKGLSAGGLHTCAVVGLGSAQCWGANDSGQLGDTTNAQRTTPVIVSGLASGVVAMATGATHSCALTVAGGVKCWGDNTSGQLGDNTQTQRLAPVNVSGLASGVKAIAAGDNHTCALTNAGGVKCWGQNGNGQVGDSSTTMRLAPVDVMGLTSGVIAIDGGALHTCAVTATNGVKCWGWNGLGQLGDSTMTERHAPVDVSGLTSGASAVAIGQFHSCALVGAGVKCWGDNSAGQLGDSTGSQHSVPVNVSGLASGVTGVAAGNAHTCAVLSGGGAKCWGDNTYGQVGDGTSANTRLAPVDVVGVVGASAVAAGGFHSCARLGGGLACWGLDSNGQLGDGTVTMRAVPGDVVGLAALGVVTGGGTHTCALTAGGGIRCWGGNETGQIGDGTQLSRLAPTAPSGLTGGLTAAVAGNNHTCAIVGGGAKCWGDNSFGQLGDATQFQRLTPVDVSGLAGVTAMAASVGGDHTCAVAGGGAKCWGYNSNGQLGDGSNMQRLAPVAVTGLASGVAAMAAGTEHTCALTSGGGVKCWGFNFNGQVGDGTQSPRSAPVDVSGLTSGIAAIATGGNHSCAVTNLGAARCWGLNTSGQLGDGTTSQRLSSVGVSGLSSGVAAITAGINHTCALTTGGGVKCWGDNSRGQLGDGTTSQRLTPVDVSGLTSGVIAISAGQMHTCALVTNAGVKCWGENKEGELGDGTMGTRPFPASVLVIGPAVLLTVSTVNGGANVAVGTPFNAVVQSLDAGGTPAPVIAGTGVSLGLVGPGAMGGVTTCTIAAAANSCTASGATIDTAQIGALISANRTSGDALTGGLSSSFNVIATAPGSPTGIVAVQTQGGILVTFNAPGFTGGAPIISYTVTCNPGAVATVGAASPVLVTGLTNNTPYTCNVRATNTVGSGGVSSPSGLVFYTVGQRTFVASNGADSSSFCAPTAPCRTLATALIHTVTGGEVIVLDSAPYDVITITQPVSILAAAGIFAGISAQPGQSAITVAAGPADSVFLRGLVITSEGGNNGILFSNGGALYLENMVVRGYKQVGQVDVNFQPSGAARLFVKDSRIQSGATGLRIANAGVDVGVTIDNVRFEGNGTGIKAVANGQLMVRNSVVAEGSQDGISLSGANALPLTAAFDKLLVSGNAAAGITSGGALPVYATVSRSTVRGNGGTGIFVSNGATSSVTRVAQSTISRNATGVGTGAGGSILSRGDNTVEANNADGSFTGPYSGK